MKKLRGSLAAKIIAILLLCLLVLTCVGSLGCILYLSDMNAYTQGYDTARRSELANICWNLSYSAWEEYQNGVDPDYILLNTNFRFAILDGDGKEVYSNYDGQETAWQVSKAMVPDIQVETFYVDPDGEGDDTPGVYQVREAENDENVEVAVTLPVPTGTPTAYYRVTELSTGEQLTLESEAEITRWQQEHSYTVRGYILEDMAESDQIAHRLSWLALAWRLRYTVIWTAALSFLAGVGLFLFLLSAAGHRDESETITLNFFDRLPWDLFTLVLAVGILLCANLAVEATYFNGSKALSLVLFGAGVLGAGLLFLFWCMSTASRVKTGSVFKNCLIYRVLAWFGRNGKKVLTLIAKGLRTLPLLWRWAAILAVGIAAELLLLVLCEGEGVAAWAIHLFVFCPLILALIWQMRKLRLGAREIADGNLSYTIDTKHLYGELREHAEDLNRIRDGMNRAVDERVKSEHFRTELITNVSHDIKTPLTSIVNYVDLLAKEEPESETVREYVEVLSRQSARLKKLIDDLIEASKASTGNLSVNLERCELGVLLDQATGEYGEKLAQAGLELVLQKPAEPVTILADGRHLWRIFDNLLSNIVKYALPGTRVYLDLQQEDGKAVVTFRNISRSRLHVSGEELLERFVRGDSSRNTEGSGLGLSIAQSLTKLQKGDMELTVDGDLFKVTVRFDTV